MRVESSVFTISWIPSEAVTGANKAIFQSGVLHYDEPPPDPVVDLVALRAADGFRFANRLSAWIDVEDGRIVGHGYSGGGLMGSTTVRLGPGSATFAAVALPDLRADPEIREASARFVQTTGGRPALPAPRRVRHPPFLQFRGPTVWTTLALTIHADGSAENDLIGASPFPRHWVYDASGKVAAKAGLADFKEWYRSAFGMHTPWGDEDSKALVTAVETALERDLSNRIMRAGRKPHIRRLKRGTTLVEQGDESEELFLVLNGVVEAVVDGEPLAQFGPGAILGERALLERGRRTATVRTVTKATVAVCAPDTVDREALERLSLGHHREDR